MATMDEKDPRPTERVFEDHATTNSRDDAAMADVGKVQQLSRHFGFWTILGLTASMMCSWPAVFFANSTAMINGGPPTLIYGFIYAFFGQLATAASLAEMASIYPTSGGQYHFTAALAPPSQKAFLSWICGWLATIGWIANLAIAAYFAGTMIQGILVSNDPSYVFERWHGTLLMWAVILVVFFINCVGTRLLALIEGGVMIVYLAAYLAILIPLVYLSPHGSAHDVFVTFTNNAGWSSNGLAWFVGLAISANLPLVGYDAPCHLAEEVINSRSNVPKAMVAVVLVNGLLTFGMIIAFSFCIVPTLTDALSSPTGYDFIEVFFRAAGRTGVAGMTSVLIVLMWLATTGFLATSSRQTWAFARDRGLPFSDYFAHVNKTLALPLRAIVLSSIIPCLLALINIGSSAAFNAFASITETCLFISYIIPIILFMMKKIKKEEIRYGPWSMGRLGIPVNAFSVIFLIISTLFSLFPPATPVTAVTMNWSIAVVGGFLILGLAWYWLIGRHRYSGPIVERPLLGGSYEN